MQVQEKIKNLMTEQFKNSETYEQLKTLQMVKKQIEKVTDASKDIDFHLERYSDISKRFKQKRETVLA